MRALSLCLALASIGIPAHSAATVLLGATVNEQYYYPNLATPYGLAVYSPQAFVVGAGQESIVDLENFTLFNVNFGDTSLEIALDVNSQNAAFASAGFNGLVFTSTAFGTLTGATVSGATNIVGFDSTRVSLVGNELRLNFSGLSYNTNSALGLQFTTAAAVPEPPTWAMMLLGFGATGIALRRRRRPQNQLQNT